MSRDDFYLFLFLKRAITKALLSLNSNKHISSEIIHPYLSKFLIVDDLPDLENHKTVYLFDLFQLHLRAKRIYLPEKKISHGNV